MGNLEIWAHRGAPLGRGELPPENTLSAFRRAMEAGADALEFDLHLTRDGHLVVHHDLELCHPRLGQVALPDLNLNEIREITLGKQQERIPTFQEVVDLARERRIPLIPELKTPDAAEKRGLDPVAALCHELDELDIYDQVVVQCFHSSTLTQLRRERPNMKLLALYRHDQVVDLNEVPGNAEYLGIPMLSVFFFGRDTVAKAKTVGKKVVPWRDMSLSENPEVFDRLLEFEVDAIMVDDAERALIHYNRVPTPPGYETVQRDLMAREEPAHSRRSRKPA
jgi:glycerophosphoryl diester phosphodiesterase